MKENKNKRITLKDIAAAANCSIAVASRALSTDSTQNGTVNAQTAKAVIEAARSLKYTPRHSSLKQKPLGRVGVFIPEIYSSQLLSLLKGISSEAEKYDTPLHYFANATGTSYRQFAENYISRNRMTGVISYYHNDPRHRSDFLYMCAKLRRCGAPLVIIHNNAPPDFDAVSVKFDNYYGGRLAGEYLHSLRCSAYYIFCGSILPDEKENLSYELKKNYLSSRVSGCYNYLNTCTPDQCNIISSQQLMHPVADNHIQLQKLYDVIDLNSESPQGIFCTSGGMTLNLSGYLQSKGVQIGKQVKIIGYDDEFFCEYAYPSITSIRQPFELMGKKAVQKLFNMMQGKKESSELIKPELIKRAST